MLSSRVSVSSVPDKSTCVCVCVCVRVRAGVWGYVRLCAGVCACAGVWVPPCMLVRVFVCFWLGVSAFDAQQAFLPSGLPVHQSQGLCLPHSCGRRAAGVWPSQCWHGQGKICKATCKSRVVRYLFWTPSDCICLLAANGHPAHNSVTKRARRFVALLLMFWFSLR